MRRFHKKNSRAITLCNSIRNMLLFWKKKINQQEEEIWAKGRALFIIHQCDGGQSLRQQHSLSIWKLLLYLHLPGTSSECWNMCRWQPSPCGSSAITCIFALGSFRLLQRLMFVNQEKRYSHSWLPTQATIPLRSFSVAGSRGWIIYCPLNCSKGFLWLSNAPWHNCWVSQNTYAGMQGPWGLRFSARQEGNGTCECIIMWQ
jgi:hypothetical protein